jgi:hypothetical protein
MRRDGPDADPRMAGDGEDSPSEEGIDSTAIDLRLCPAAARSRHEFRRGRLSWFTMWRVLIVLVTVLTVAGCAGNSPDDDGTNALNLTELVTILPTQPGLDQASSEIRRVDGSALEATFARRDSTDSKGFDEIGFREGVIRTWSGPDGADMLVAVSRWPDHQIATSVGGGAADQPLNSPGASAWNPEQISGSRGARVNAPGSPSRVLAIAVGEISLVVRADGPVTDAAVIRVLDLVSRPVRSAIGRA